MSFVARLSARARGEGPRLTTALHHPYAEGFATPVDSGIDAQGEPKPAIGAPASPTQRIPSTTPIAPAASSISDARRAPVSSEIPRTIRAALPSHVPSAAQRAPAVAPLPTPVNAVVQPPKQQLDVNNIHHYHHHESEQLRERVVVHTERVVSAPSPPTVTAREWSLPPAPRPAPHQVLPLHRARALESPPPVHVHIGRLIVSAETPAPPKRSPRPAAPTPKDLAQHIAERQRGRR